MKFYIFVPMKINNMSATVNIGIFGRRNTGKSSLINTVVGQEVSIVSDRPGTTTDPVRKRMEIFGLGPCVFIDTAGIDDSGELGEMRVARTEEVIRQIDIALLLFTADMFGDEEDRLMEQFARYSLPVVIIHSMSDKSVISKEMREKLHQRYPGVECLDFSSVAGPDEIGKMSGCLVDAVRAGVSRSQMLEKPMFDGIVSCGQKVLLVCPIDSEAPTGRLILPQVLFHNGNREGYSLVVTDSQAFSEVASVVPEEVPLTSFSMLLARSKGCFEQYCKGTPMIDRLQDGDRVLILESCSHHSSCEDIGRVKIPALMRRRTGKSLTFDVVGGLDRIARPITDYSLVLQCGGCMITRRQLYSRLLPAMEEGIPVTNYGMAISYMKGIYERALKPLLVR